MGEECLNNLATRHLASALHPFQAGDVSLCPNSMPSAAVTTHEPSNGPLIRERWYAATVEMRHAHVHTSSTKQMHRCLRRTCSASALQARHHRCEANSSSGNQRSQLEQ